MGRGDRKSKRGKIWRGTHGKKRPRKIRTKFIAKEGNTEKKKS